MPAKPSISSLGPTDNTPQIHTRHSFLSVNDLPFTFLPSCQQRVARQPKRIQNLLRNFSARHGIFTCVKQPQLDRVRGEKYELHVKTYLDESGSLIPISIDHCHLEHRLYEKGIPTYAYRKNEQRIHQHIFSAYSKQSLSPLKAMTPTNASSNGLPVG